MYSLPVHHSIQSIHKVLPTDGSRPVVVMCEDFKLYVCKYSSPPAQTLFREFLGYQFARLWQIPVPPAALIHIADEHVPDAQLDNRIQRAHFRQPCFGSQWMDAVTEVDDSFLSKTDGEIKGIDRGDFLRIALFDQWLSNEDRSSNNLNLLLFMPAEGFQRFVAIDHVNLFNTGAAPPYPFTQLTYEDSLIHARHFTHLFPNSKKPREQIAETCESLHTFAENCKVALPAMLASVPPEWGIDTAAFLAWANANLFTESWLRETKQTYQSFIQLAFTSVT